MKPIKQQFSRSDAVRDMVIDEADGLTLSSAFTGDIHHAHFRHGGLAKLAELENKP
jgi:hypothetical protein